MRFTFEGTPMRAFAGESVAAALLASGIRSLRTTPGGEPRGLFCGMGVCFDCLVEIDGVPYQRACRLTVKDGMSVRRQTAEGHWDSGELEAG